VLIGGICVPPTVNCLQYLVTGSTLTAVGPFQLPAPQSGTHSRISSGTRPSVWTVSDSCLKLNCSLDTSAFSALEVLTTIALYKFTYLLTYLLTLCSITRWSMEYVCGLFLLFHAQQYKQASQKSSYISRLHCKIYTHNMATSTVNTNNTGRYNKNRTLKRTLIFQLFLKQEQNWLLHVIKQLISSVWANVIVCIFNIYTVSGKKGHDIFNYKSRIPWSIFIIFIPLETGMNTPQSRVIYLLKIFMTS